MSCPQITPLLLSDTFNTWFERTNLMISTMNTMNVHGITAMENSGFKIEATGGSGCTYNLSLQLGPFLGFVTGGSIYDSGVYGTGDAENPYKLTMRFSGTERELGYTEVATADYVLVSDTSDDSEFKKVSANAFLTRLNSGNNIVIGDNLDGSYTISYNESSFVITTTTDNNLTQNLEVGKTFNTSVTFTAEATIQSTIGLTSGYVSAPGNKVTDFGTKQLSVNDSGVGSVSSNVNIPSQDWYTVNNTSVTFTFGATSNDVDKQGNPVQPLFDTDTKTKTYGLQFVVFAGNYGTTGQIQSEFNNFYTGASGVSSQLVTNPKVRRSYTWSFGGGGSQFYWFAHTEKSTTENYGFEPRFYPDNGQIVESGFESFGFVIYDGRTYEIFRSPSAYPTGGVFGVGE